MLEVLRSYNESAELVRASVNEILSVTNNLAKE